MTAKRYGLTGPGWETIHVVACESRSRMRSILNRPLRGAIQIGRFEFLVVLIVVAVSLPLAKAASGPLQLAGPLVTSDASKASVREVSGQVVDPNGRPVAGAWVALGTTGRSGKQYTGAVITPPALCPVTDSSGTTSEIVETDAEGRFSFRAVSGNFMAVASHETGFARVDVRDFTPSMIIRLERWGRIEGTLYVGRRPARYEIVRLSFSVPDYASEVYYRHETSVDRNGRFVLQQVVPGRLWIAHRVQIIGQDSTSEFSAINRQVYVRPGQTLKIEIGGTGRPVIGTLVLPVDSSRPAGWRWGLASLRRLTTEAPKPASYDQMTESQHRQWYEEWARTPQGQIYSRSGIYSDPNWPSYQFDVESDNRFGVEDVTPGRYELSVALWNPAAEGVAQMVGSYSAIFKVPPMRETYMDEPLDLGEVLLKGEEGGRVLFYDSAEERPKRAQSLAFSWPKTRLQ